MAEVIPCPVCGSVKIIENTESNGICGPGYHSWVTSEYCADCGVMLNPDRKPRKPTWVGVNKEEGIPGGFSALGDLTVSEKVNYEVKDGKCNTFSCLVFRGGCCSAGRLFCINHS